MELDMKNLQCGQSTPNFEKQKSIIKMGILSKIPKINIAQSTLSNQDTGIEMGIRSKIPIRNLGQSTLGNQEETAFVFPQNSTRKIEIDANSSKIPVLRTTTKIHIPSTSTIPKCPKTSSLYKKNVSKLAKQFENDNNNNVQFKTPAKKKPFKTVDVTKSPTYNVYGSYRMASSGHHSKCFTVSLREFI